MESRRPIKIAAFAVVAVLALACGGGDDEEFGAETRDSEGRIVLPPSAGAPQADLGREAPDTLRPPPDTLAAPPDEADWRIEEPRVDEETDGRRRQPQEFDLQAIVDAYRRYYTEEFYEVGSEIRGGTDPALERDAKRRTALDWGYVDTGAWSDLIGDLTRDQRIVVADRIAAANAELARRLHGSTP